MNLKEKIVKGASYLAARQVLGLIIGVGGTTLLTRIIGPGNYGLYASALGIVSYLSNLTGLGVNVYIIRRRTEPETFVYYQAFTLTFITGTIGLLLGVAIIPLLQRWFNNPAFIPPLYAMVLALPFTSMIGTAMARLERDLNFRAVAAVEFTGQIIYYIFALTLAYKGKGVWAPVSGYIILQFFQLTITCILSKLLPRPYWSKSMFKEMIGYGAGYSASMWVWQLRTLVNPLIVGRFLGPEGVGCIALTIRLVEAFCFVKDAIWRLSVAVLAKVQEDFSRLKRGMEQAMAFQVFSLGLLLACFACLAPWFLKTFLSGGWDGILTIYPFIALSYLVNALFNIHSSFLYVLKRNGDVALFHLAHIMLFAGGAFLFVPFFGIPGYGLAEVLALLSYTVIYFQVERLFHLSYLKSLPWLIAFSPPLFTTITTFPSGLFLWMPFLGVILASGPQKSFLEYKKIFKKGKAYLNNF